MSCFLNYFEREFFFSDIDDHQSKLRGFFEIKRLINPVFIQAVSFSDSAADTIALAGFIKSSFGNRLGKLYREIRSSTLCSFHPGNFQRID